MAARPKYNKEKIQTGNGKLFANSLPKKKEEATSIIKPTSTINPTPINPSTANTILQLAAIFRPSRAWLFK